MYYQAYFYYKKIKRWFYMEYSLVKKSRRTFYWGREVGWRGALSPLEKGD
jgi:hypothetical protein